MKNRLFTLISFLSLLNFAAMGQCTTDALPEFIAGNVCLGDTVNIIDLSSNVDLGKHTYLWDYQNDGIIDDSTMGSHVVVPDTAGTYNVNLTIADTNGCTATVIHSVTVYTRPVAEFSSDLVCSGLATSFTDLSTSAGINPTYQWDLNNDGSSDTATTGSFSYTFPAAGDYPVTLNLTSSDGCTDTTTHNVVVFISPVAGFFADTTCLGSSTLFSDLTTPSGTTGIYEWDLDGNGTVDTVTTSGSLSAIYPDAGVFETTLLVTTDNGCTSNFSDSIVILPGANVSFATSGTSCTGGPVNFTDQSTGVDSSATYAWDLNGDNITDQTTKGNVTYVFTTSGTYNASLTITNENGCSTTFTKSLTIASTTLSVSAGADKTVICGASATLSGVANQTGVTYSWSPSNMVSNPFIAAPSATPSETTVFTLTANKGGCSVVDSVTVTVTPLVITAGVDKTVTCGSSTTVSTTTNGSSIIYSWSPTTGLNNSASASVTATPALTTTYTVTATRNACIATDTVIVNVNPLIINAGSNKTITCSASATLTSTVNNTTGISYLWSPSTGLSNPTTLSPVASPATTTTYTVTASNSNCTAYDTVVVVVNSFGLNAGSDKTIICGGSTGLTATASGVTQPSYSWSPSTGLSNPFVSNPTVTTDSQMTYVVTATKGSCVSTDTLVINVSTDLPIGFTATKTYMTAKPYTTIFNNTTTGSSNYTYLWDFGDSTSSTLTSPAHTYTNQGVYTVKLYATSLGGNCKDSLVLVNYITATTPAGIDESDLASTIRVYPNPSSGSFVIKHDLIDNRSSVELFDITGKQLNSIIISPINSSEILVKANNLPKGLYFIKLSVAEKTITKKIVIE